jgi:glycosyltransferase involved in cell wall biosynthesis
LASRVIELLNDPAQRARLGAAARDFAVRHYDLRSVCLPRQMRWVEQIVGG